MILRAKCDDCGRVINGDEIRHLNGGCDICERCELVRSMNKAIGNQLYYQKIANNALATAKEYSDSAAKFDAQIKKL